MGGCVQKVLCPTAVALFLLLENQIITLGKLSQILTIVKVV